MYLDVNVSKFPNSWFCLWDNLSLFLTSYWHLFLTSRHVYSWLEESSFYTALTSIFVFLPHRWLLDHIWEQHKKVKVGDQTQIRVNKPVFWSRWAYSQWEITQIIFSIIWYMLGGHVSFLWFRWNDYWKERFCSYKKREEMLCKQTWLMCPHVTCFAFA